jgi:amino acid adenylation domain-containing protein
LTNTVLEDRSILLKDINLLSITEQNELVSSFNFEELSYDKDSSLVDIFKEKASLYPDRIAVQYGQEYITYKELDVRSNKLAHYLRSKNIVYGNVVALLLDRSIDMIVGILGVLKSGAAYMPIDPSLPEQRIGYMLDQSRSSFLLAEHKYMETYSAYLPVASINDAMLSSQPKEEVLVRVTTSDLAYCIFTSGSSGKPKGVMMSQGSVVNLVKGLEQNVYSKYKEENLKVALLASYAFDASVQQIFGSLLLGHSLIIADDQSRKDGLKLREFYNTNDIDISDGTPTHMRLLVNAIQRGQSLPYLRSWILAGEVLPKELVVSFFKKVGSSVQLYNFYGPTETCVDSTFFKVNPEKLDRYETIPIGKPLPNERVYVTNKYGKLVPKGVRGELCIAGSGLARCYAGNQELTSECFVANWLPWESRVYRTGDIVKWLSDGNLEYCGRMDNQVKLRGYRIELSEIAYELNGIEAIRQSVVMIKEKNGENVLVGYYEAQEEIMVNDLRKRLAKILPQYMIPNYFVHVEKFPVSMSGKINTNSLPDYELCQSKAHVPPSNEIERQLVAIWSDILKIDKEVIGVTTDFFDLGGHSLSGIQMANNISEYFGVNLKLVEIFRKRTIQEISELIEMNRWLDSGSGGNTATTRKETVI